MKSNGVSKELYEYKKNFYQFFNEKIKLDKIEALEKTRIKYKKNYDRHLTNIFLFEIISILISIAVIIFIKETRLFTLIFFVLALLMPMAEVSKIKKLSNINISKYFAMALIVLTSITLVMAILKERQYAMLFSWLSMFLSFAMVWLSTRLSIWNYFKKREIENEFLNILKSEFLEPLLGCFNNLKIERQNNITLRDISNSQIFEGSNNITYDDVFSLEYKGITCDISECALYSTKDNVNSIILDALETGFRGVIIKYKFNKAIRSRTAIVPRGNYIINPDNITYVVMFFLILILIPIAVVGFHKDPINSLLTLAICVGGICMLPSLFRWTNNGKENLKPIQLEDVNFAKRYKAYSSNQVEGRYLLTSAFIDRFVNMQHAFRAKRVRCAFYDKYLLFAISTNKNLFEFGSIRRTVKNPKFFEEIFNQMTSVMLLVDYFKLNENIGL